MSDKKYIQPQRFQTSLKKTEAIARVELYVSENISTFKNGEEILIEYLNEGNEKTICSAVVIINGPNASILTTVSDKDTLKIIEKGGNEGPEDKKNLWLSDNWDDEVSEDFPADNIRSTVKNLSERILFLESCLESLLVTKTLGGGDIIAQSKKYELENEHIPLMPDDADYPYTTGSTVIESWDVTIGDSPLSTFAEGGLYVNENYYLKPYATNIQGEQIDPSALTLEAVVAVGNATIDENNVLSAAQSGSSEIVYVIHNISDPEWTASTKTQLVTFERNEKPNYNLFNIEHLLVKHVETKQLIEENFDYILVGEFCWCIEEQALYLKERAKNGTIQLFKINGSGSVGPSGETVVITYFVDAEGKLNANSSDDTININENGVLTLIGTINDNGVLSLNDTEIDSLMVQGEN